MKFLGVRTQFCPLWWKGGVDETQHWWNSAINHWKLNMTTFCNCLWCESENCLYVAFVFMIFVSCLLWKRQVYTLDDTCWMVRCFLWVHLLWCGYFPAKALIVVCRVMELMLEIKKCDCFKDKGRTKLNYAKLGHRIGFSFGLIVWWKYIASWRKIILCCAMYLSRKDVLW